MKISTPPANRLPARRFLVTRHPGALEWLRGVGVAGTHVTHLAPGLVSPGDIVIGTLPVSLAAEVCRLGGRYVHLCASVPEGLRGTELSREELVHHSASLRSFIVHPAPAQGLP